MSEIERNIGDTAPAVIGLAFLDAFSPGLTLPGCQSRTARIRARAEALEFLTAPIGLWAEARTLWCDAADIPPDLVREHAERMRDRKTPILSKSIENTSVKAHPIVAEIDAYCVAKGWNNADFCRASGIPSSSLSNYRCARCQPRANVIEKARRVINELL